MKKVVSVKPKIYEKNSNFKLAPYYSWVESGGRVVAPYYKWWPVYPLVNLVEKVVPKSRKKALLVFAEPPSLSFDSFPYYAHYEIIPVLWDCWPYLYEQTEAWFKRHKVKSAIFTSSQTADVFQKKFPKMEILTITEGIETDLYGGERILTNRSIDFLSFGRVCENINCDLFSEHMRVLSSRNEYDKLTTRTDLISALSDSKITYCVPRCDNQPEIAEGVETLTQRYWECMLSGVLIVGRAPKELVECVGYNPVIPVAQENLISSVEEILLHISDYQELVDANRNVALAKGDWSLRINKIKNWLRSIGYEI